MFFKKRVLCNCLLSLETTSLLALKNHLPNDSYDMKNTGLWACLSGPYWHTRVLRVDDAVHCELDGTWNSWGVWAVGGNYFDCINCVGKALPLGVTFPELRCWPI